MSISLKEFKEFKEIQNFWRSLEENNPVPSLKCSYFRRRTLIKSQSDQSNESNQLSNRSEVGDFEEHISLDNQLPSPEIVITGVNLSENQSIEGLNLIENGCVKDGLTSNASEPIEELELSTESGDDGNLYQEFSDDECANQEMLSELKYGNQFLGPNITVGRDNDNAIPDKPGPSITSNINIEDRDSEEDIFDDNWLLQKNHIFVLSFAGKPIFSLQKHGYEDKMGSLFALIQCFINIYMVRKDRISSIEAEGIRFVFLVRNALYLVAASREDISTYHLKLRLREVYNRIVFLLTFANLYHVFQYAPGYDLRRELCGNYNLISNQLTTKIRVSNNIFTLFTNTIRVLPLHPILRYNITNIIKKKCAEISSLAFAVLIVNDQLVALVRLRKHTIHASDIRLILNLMDCSENLFNNFNLWMLPICLPNFNEDSYLHAFISRLSNECDAFFILLSCDRNMVNELSKAHCEITEALRSSDCFTSICKANINLPQEGNGFNIGAINIPKLWHFMFIPKASNQQLLCSKIIAPYTCLSEFKRLEAIYRDLHLRIHKESRPSKVILEVKEKEVAVALDTDIAEIYAVFDPLVNTQTLAKYYIKELVDWITFEQGAYFIPDYPTFK